ncbi:MAG: CYTH domain-containing protein [Hyphomicrobiaceae bacterium]
MADEIERKFLVTNDDWRRTAVGEEHLCQFYLATTGRSSIRVRIRNDAEARLTIKSAKPGPRRDEFEYAIPLEDAHALRALAIGSVIEKVRHIVPADPSGALRWEVDVFGGAHEGLVIAEIELQSTDQSFDRPEWLGKDVTDDERYYNAALARHAPIRS